MSEPPPGQPVDEVADEASLGRLWNRVKAVEAAHEDLQSQQVATAAAADTIHSMLTQLNGRQQAPDGDHQPDQAGETGPDGEEAVAYQSWAAQADQDAWAGLADWVDWFQDTYDLISEVVFDCWPAHGGVVEELAGLKLAWEQAVAASAKSDWAADEALAYWHDRYLAGTVHRLGSFYRLKACRTGHEVDKRRPRTDRSMITIRSTGVMPFAPAQV